MAIHGSKQAKGCLKRSSAKTVWQLFKYSRNQLRTMAGPQTGYCHLKDIYTTGTTWVIFVPAFLHFFLFYSISGFSPRRYQDILGLGRLFTTAASNRNFVLKNSHSFNVLSFPSVLYNWVTQWRSWLRHGTTSRKVAGSIPEVSIRTFH